MKKDMINKKLLTFIALSAHHRRNKPFFIYAKKQWQDFFQRKQTDHDEQFLQIIDTDPDKYEQWLTQHQAVISQPRGLLGFFDKFHSNWLRPALVATVLLLSVIIVMLPTVKPTLLDQSFAYFTDSVSINSEELDSATVLLDGNESFAFLSDNHLGLKLESFKYGIKLGRARLLSALADSESPELDVDNSWMSFGEWFQLNYFAVNNSYTIDASYWQLQIKLLDQYQRVLNAAPSLQGIRAVLEQLQHTPDSVRLRQNLRSQLANYSLALQVALGND